MNKMVILSATSVLALAGFGSYALTRPADAQDAPSAATSERSAEHDRHGWDRGPHHHHHGMMGHAGFGLFAPVADKSLSVADVQTIAEAMLLRHGNHTWKVASVTQNQDNTVSFAFTTADGGVIARFAIDTHSGRLNRVG